MGPAKDLNYLIHHLAAVMGKQTEQVLQEQLGVGLSQYKILMVLEWNPRIGQKAIADSLGQTEAAVSRQIKLLKSKNLLATKPDPGNRRKHITTPTPLGMQLTEAADGILRRSQGADFAKLGDDQLTRLSTGLQQLHRLVCKPGRTGACGHQLGL